MENAARAGKPATLIKAAIALTWLILFALLLKRDIFIATLDPGESATLQQAQREEYQGIYFQDKKIGFVASTFEGHEDRTVTMTQKAKMNLNVAGSQHLIDLRLTAKLAADNRLQNFTLSFQSPFYRMRADGKADGNRVAFTLSTGSTTIKDSLNLDAPPMLSTSRRAFLLQKDLEVGEKIRIPWFDPLSLTGKDSVIEYRGKEKILIHGRVQNLHHFVEVLSGARVNSWIDDEGDVLKEESPAGFVFLKEAKFKALSGSEEGPELLSAVSPRLIGSMPRYETLASIQYRLRFPEDETFQLDSGRQRYTSGLLTIDLEVLPDPAMENKPCPQPEKYLAATPAIQSDHPEIRRVAEKAIAGLSGNLAQARALAAYVHNHLEKRPVIGLPDALTTLATGQGDCNEHAVLFAALARASGIPCRIAAGVVFIKGSFYYHAWNEICIGGKWLSLDTTSNQLPADLSHIKFIEGETSEQMRIGALLGQLSIEPLPQPISPESTQNIQPRQKAPMPVENILQLTKEPEL